jgi:hypothetical protein
LKNQYVGDIGDYGKYGLLRFLANHGICIGVNWYLTENDESADGKFTDYLKDKDSPDRRCDPELFDALRKIVLPRSIQEKNVDMIREAELIPNACYYNSLLPDSNQDAKAREINRRFWLNNSLLMLGEADLIFADPDNGLSFRKSAGNKGSEKYVLPEEIEKYYWDGKDVVYYCHKGRRKPEAWEQAKTEIRTRIRDAQILGVTFHRGTQRSYIFVVHPDQYRKYVLLLNKFGKTAWIRMFEREPIQGNVLTISEERMLGYV